MLKPVLSCVGCVVCVRHSGLHAGLHVDTASVRMRATRLATEVRITRT